MEIIGIPPSREDEIVEKLTRSSRLKITPSYVTLTDELNNELLSSHLVLILPTTTSYVNLTIAGMCAAIPVVYPRGSHSHELVNTHIDVIEAKECAIDMDEDPKDLKQRIISVMLRNPTALERAKIIRDHIKDKVVEDLRNSNENFFSAITADMQASSNDQNDLEKETKSGESKVTEQPTVPQVDRRANNIKTNSSISDDQIQQSQTTDAVRNISSGVVDKKLQVRKRID
ncbi:uncharacterized protein [Ptychodera flava]|uniref:uncharacterized protein n=1 Tax=Ptychodera flava TaxID=63121 RepID=UPI003969F372